MHMRCTDMCRDRNTKRKHFFLLIYAAIKTVYSIPSLGPMNKQIHFRDIGLTVLDKPSGTTVLSACVQCVHIRSRHSRPHRQPKQHKIVASVSVVFICFLFSPIDSPRKQRMSRLFFFILFCFDCVTVAESAAATVYSFPEPKLPHAKLRNTSKRKEKNEFDFIGSSRC